MEDPVHIKKLRMQSVNVCLFVVSDTPRAAVWMGTTPASVLTPMAPV